MRVSYTVHTSVLVGPFGIEKITSMSCIDSILTVGSLLRAPYNLEGILHSFS